MAQRRYIESVSRALDVLELVANSSDGLRLRHVARGLGMHRQTAYKVLDTLVHRGFLTKLPHPPRYKLGPTMKALRDRQDRWNRTFLLPSIPKLIGLSRAVSADVTLCQYVAGEVTGRFTSPARASRAPTLLYGDPWASYGGSLVLQAFMTEEQLAT